MTWVLTFASLFGNFLNSMKIRSCFYIWIICNIGWLTIDINMKSYSRAFLDTIQIIFCILGLFKWESSKNK